MSEMCRTCPHWREHNVGDEMQVCDTHPASIHPCHSNTKVLCRGHQLQVRKFALGEDHPKQYPNIKIIHYDYYPGD